MAKLMRFAITFLLAMLLWGYASLATDDAGIPKWISVVGLLFVGIVLQLIYTRLINWHFDAIDMREAVRWRLRNDRGIVPFWIAGTGIVARAFIVAGTILPLLEAVGWMERVST